MERVTTKEAAKLLNMDVVTLQFLMRQERLPIGYAIKKMERAGIITSFTEVCWMRLFRAEGNAKWQENDITG